MKKWRKVFVVPAVFFMVLFLAEQEGMSKPSQEEVIQKSKRLQMPFIVNEGQTDERVKFYANTFLGTIFVTKNGEIVYSLPNSKDTGVLKDSGNNALHSLKDTSRNNLYNSSKYEIKGIALKEELVGGKINEIKGGEKSITKVNYFKGKDPSRWKTDISTYGVVVLGEVYYGIDLKLRAYGDNVEKLFHVKPDANPSQIKLKISGAKALRVDEEGRLEAETNYGIVKFTKPVAYQEIDGKRVEVGVKYNLLNTKSKIVRLSAHDEVQNHKSEYGFTVAAYDKTRELVIDPLLASTFLGGSDYDYVSSIAIDPDGNVYVTGRTGSSDFPTTTGAYTMNNVSSSDAFISKLNGDLTNLLASTFLGGSDDDSSKCIAIDSGGNVYVTGRTESSDFPTTPGVYDTSFHGNRDVFVSKLSGDLTTLIASTFLGGTDDDSSKNIAVDSGGNVYVAGETFSSNFPTTPGAYDTNNDSDSSDVFVSRLDSNLTSLLASTYLGASADDSGLSMAIDPGGKVYVTGETFSSNFPTTAGAYATSPNGSCDAFVSMLDGDLTTLFASTFLGGPAGDSGKSIAIDSGGNIYVTGETFSSIFPITPGAYDTNNDIGSSDAFISRLDGNLTSLLASTYLGASADDSGLSMAIDHNGNVYVTGETFSSIFPTTPDAYDTSSNGGRDAFVSKLDNNLTNLLASTYLGASADDSGLSMAIDHDGNVYVTGETFSSNFPTTPGAYDTTPDGSSDAFVSKFDSNLSASNLLALYSFDEGSGTIAADSSGNGRNGTINGATWTTGKSGSGLSFDGTDDVVSIPIMNNNEVSISAWFFKNANDTTHVNAIFGGYTWNSDLQFREGFDVRFHQNAPDTLEFIVVTQDGSGTRAMRTARIDLVNSVGSWYHVTGTYNKTTGEQKLYVNGQIVNTQTHPAGNTIVPLTSYADMRIGASGITGYFNGVIDDVRLNSQVLSDQEVQDVYYDL